MDVCRFLQKRHGLAMDIVCPSVPSFSRHVRGVRLDSDTDKSEGTRSDAESEDIFRSSEKVAWEAQHGYFAHKPDDMSACCGMGAVEVTA